MNVKGVHRRGFDPKGSVRTLNLLALQTPEKNEVHLHFSGGGDIRVQMDQLHCHLGDLQEPWPTRKKPTHLYEHLEAML
jgi:hypothetical protein